MSHLNSALALFGAIVLAPAGAAPPDPANAVLAVPPTVHRSAFEDYRPNREQAVGDWRKANAEVARVGGWRAYAREAQAPAASASAPSATGVVAPLRSTP